MEILNICKEFNINGDIIEIVNNTMGLINKSYVVKTSTNDYIVQKINCKVFKEPLKLMDNIEKIVNFLNENKKISCNELYLIPTKVGKNCLIKNNEFYRCYNFIKESITYNKIETNKQMYELGKTVGKFQFDLKDFETSDLFNTIEDFHNTKKRYDHLVEVFINSNKYLQSETINLYLYIVNHCEYYSKIIDQLNNNLIPYRVVHNDTKLNNVIFNKKTNKAKCLIDLDTVMPGSLLYDFGDALRSAASSLKEDDKNFEKVYFDEKLFTYFFIGFYKNVLNIMTDEEIDLLVDSIYIITMECAIRFLTDYLEGNVYFKINYPNHNLIRAKNQIVLAQDILNKQDRLKHIIKKIIISFENFK